MDTDINFILLGTLRYIVDVNKIEDEIMHYSFLKSSTASEGDK